MNRSRRIARMSRRKSAIPTLQLTSLMDVFTTLVFFLVVNSGAAVETLQRVLAPLLLARNQLAIEIQPHLVAGGEVGLRADPHVDGRFCAEERFVVRRLEDLEQLVLHGGRRRTRARRRRHGRCGHRGRRLLRGLHGRD